MTNSNLPPGVTDRMIDAEFGDDSRRCAKCDSVLDDHGRCTDADESGCEWRAPYWPDPDDYDRGDR